jgi:hypothetical protein
MRPEAIACFLSAGEGWSEALRDLGGSFATLNTARLNSSKAK